MSVALHAIRYPYRTRSTLSCAMINRSFCSRSSSRMIGSRRTARSWYDYNEDQPVASEDARPSYFSPWIAMMIGVCLMFGYLVWILPPNAHF